MATVAFRMPAHLARTETVVANQMRTLRRHQPVVLAHRRRPETDVPLRDGAVARELLSPALARTDAALYRATRTPLPTAIAALARYARARDVRLLHYHYLTDARFM